jgi:hypothetical protein
MGSFVSRVRSESLARKDPVIQPRLNQLAVTSLFKGTRRGERVSLVNLFTWEASSDGPVLKRTAGEEISWAVADSGPEMLWFGSAVAAFVRVKTMGEHGFLETRIHYVCAHRRSRCLWTSTVDDCKFDFSVLRTGEQVCLTCLKSDDAKGETSLCRFTVSINRDTGRILQNHMEYQEMARASSIHVPSISLEERAPRIMHEDYDQSRLVYEMPPTPEEHNQSIDSIAQWMLPKHLPVQGICRIVQSYLSM